MHVRSLKLRNINNICKILRKYSEILVEFYEIYKSHEEMAIALELSGSPFHAIIRILENACTI